jgi:uncharacterized protein GlcG (DUF336 family)
MFMSASFLCSAKELKRLREDAQKKTLLVATVGLFVAGPALAQTFLPNPDGSEHDALRPARARTIPATLAIEAAQAAISACRADGYRSTVVIVDSEAVPVLMVSDDGATAMSQRAAAGKAIISVKIKDSSANGKTADPKIMAGLGPARPGAFPLLAGKDVVGALAVGGTPTGKTDEACAKAGIAKIQDRIQKSALVPPPPSAEAAHGTSVK